MIRVPRSADISPESACCNSDTSVATRSRPALPKKSIASIVASRCRNVSMIRAVARRERRGPRAPCCLQRALDLT